MGNNTTGNIVMGGAVVTSLGMSCRTGASIASVIPGFTPQTFAIKAIAAGAGCLGGMASTALSTLLFAKSTASAELEFTDINMTGIDISAISALPVNLSAENIAAK